MTRQKNKRGERRGESNDSPEIPDEKKRGGGASDIPSLPSWLSEHLTLAVRRLGLSSPDILDHIGPVFFIFCVLSVLLLSALCSHLMR